MSDLQEILSRDPRTFTKDGPELKTIVEELRKARHQYNLGNAKAGSMKPKSEKAKAVSGINIGDIDL